MNTFEIFKQFCNNFRMTHWNCKGCQFHKYCSKINRNIASYEERYKNIKKSLPKEHLKYFSDE